jgi:multiple sugar transport system permease protein
MTSLTTTVPAVLTRRPPSGWRQVRRFVLPIGGLAVTLAFLAPYIVMLLDALRPSSDVVSSPATFIPRKWQLTTFSTVLSDARFLNWLKTSLLVATVSTAIDVVNSDSQVVQPCVANVKRGSSLPSAAIHPARARLCI